MEGRCGRLVAASSPLAGATGPDVCLEWGQLSGQRGQRLAASLRDQDIVLDARAAEARYVDPRFHSEDHTLLQEEIIPLYDVGLLVDLQAHAVAGAVDEVLSVSGLVDHLSLIHI